MNWWGKLFLMVGLLGIPLSLAYPNNPAVVSPQLSYCNHPVPYINGPCEPRVTPIPCSTCGEKIAVKSPMMAASSLCWMRANFPSLYRGKTFDLACPDIVAYLPMCVSTVERSYRSGLPVCSPRTPAYPFAPSTPFIRSK